MQKLWAVVVAGYFGVLIPDDKDFASFLFGYSRLNLLSALSMQCTCRHEQASPKQLSPERETLHTPPVSGQVAWPATAESFRNQPQTSPDERKEDDAMQERSSN